MMVDNFQSGRATRVASTPLWPLSCTSDVWNYEAFFTKVFPDESRLLTAGEDGVAIIWQMSGSRFKTLGPFDSPVLCPLSAASSSLEPLAMQR